MNKRTFKILFSMMMSVALLLSLASCSSANRNTGGKDGTPAKASPFYYIIPAGEADIVVDQNGNEIMRGKDLSLLSPNGYNSTPNYIISTRYVSTGEDEYGYPVGVSYSTLYSIDGTLLLDEEKTSYRQAFGKYVISTNMSYMDTYSETDTSFSNLIDPTTGAILYENVGYVTFLGENYIALNGTNGAIVDVVDSSGQHIEAFPVDLGYNGIEKYGDYYIASYITTADGSDDYSSMTWHYVLLDDTFSPISKQYNFISHNNNAYFFCSDEYDGTVSVLDATTGSIVFEADDLYYYDNELYVTRTYENTTTYMLYTADDTLLLTTENSFSMRYNEDGLLSHIYYIDPETNNAVCVDRTGTETARNTTLVAESVTIVTENLVLIETVVPAEETSLFGFYQYCLFDNSLHPVGNSPYTYDGYIYQPTDTANYFVASRRNTQGAYATLYDVLDLKGNLKLENIKMIHESTDDRLVVEWGFAVGLIDVNGNWVYKTSAFGSAAGDEEDIWWY